MKNYSLLFSLFILLAGFQNVYACMCSEENISDAYKSADLIVNAEVLEIDGPDHIEMNAKDKFKGNEDDYYVQEFTDNNGEKIKAYLGKYQYTTIKVLKSFKGENYKEIKLKQEQTTCDWSFDAGKDLNKKVLLYLIDNKDGTYSIAICSRSNWLDKSTEDLSWLNGLPNSLARNRISGKVRLNDDKSSFPAVSGIKITISGMKREINLVTDENGLYEVWDLPEGKYIVKPEVPEIYTIDWISNLEKGTFFSLSGQELKLKPLEIGLISATSTGINFMLERKKDEK